MKWSQTCKSCLFCDRGDPEGLPYLCRKDNPKPEMFLDAATMRAIWPRINSEDWCGQWMQRPGVNDIAHVTVIDLKTGNRVDEISGPVPKLGQVVCYRLPKMQHEIRLTWMIVPEKPDGAKKKCRRCNGCGQIADDEEEAPWTAWLDLPLKSSLAVLSGLVRPIECPDCKGMGET